MPSVVVRPDDLRLGEKRLVSNVFSDKDQFAGPISAGLR